MKFLHFRDNKDVLDVLEALEIYKHKHIQDTINEPAD